VLWGPLGPAGVAVVDDVVWQPTASPYLVLDAAAPWQQTGLYAYPRLLFRPGIFPGLQLQGGISGIGLSEHWQGTGTPSVRPDFQQTRQYGQFPGLQHTAHSGSVYAGAGTPYQVAQAAQPSSAGIAAQARQALLSRWTR
jgi:hypothetical protein